MEFSREAGQDIDAIRRIPRVAAISYEPVRKFASVTIEVGGKLRVYIKSAPELVLPMCDDADRERPPRETRLAAGFRVLAVVSGCSLTRCCSSASGWQSRYSSLL
jgi:magnesium-transporting ATPase (P-type)